MPYTVITDAEVDPGSYITLGLLRRLRDNPYLVIPDTALDGALGLKGRVSPGSSVDASLATDWDHPVNSGASVTNGGPLVVESSASGAVCPRAGGWVGNVPPIGPFYSAPVYVWAFVYDPLRYGESWEAFCFPSIIYDGNTPVKLALRALRFNGATPIPGSNNFPGRSVVTGAIGTSDYLELDFGAGYSLAIKTEIAGVGWASCEIAAEIDSEFARLRFRVSASSTSSVGLAAGVTNTAQNPMVRA